MLSISSSRNGIVNHANLKGKSGNFSLLIQSSIIDYEILIQSKYIWTWPHSMCIHWTFQNSLQKKNYILHYWIRLVEKESKMSWVLELGSFVLNSGTEKGIIVLRCCLVYYKMKMEMKNIFNVMKWIMNFTVLGIGSIIYCTSIYGIINNYVSSRLNE